MRVTPKWVLVAVWPPLWRPGAQSDTRPSLVTQSGNYSWQHGNKPTFHSRPPKEKQEPCFWAVGTARPAETWDVVVLSSDPWGGRVGVGSCIPPGGQSQLSLLTSLAQCPTLAPALSCTFSADNLRATCPKPKSGHVLCQRILSIG